MLELLVLPIMRGTYSIPGIQCAVWDLVWYEVVHNGTECQPIGEAPAEVLNVNILKKKTKTKARNKELIEVIAYSLQIFGIIYSL